MLLVIEDNNNKQGSVTKQKLVKWKTWCR